MLFVFVTLLTFVRYRKSRKVILGEKIFQNVPKFLYDYKHRSLIEESKEKKTVVKCLVRLKISICASASNCSQEYVDFENYSLIIMVTVTCAANFPSSAK